MSESIQTQPASSPKVLIITTLITAATTVAVSYVGMRQPSRPEASPPAPSLSSVVGIETTAPAPVKTQTIRGKVLSTNGSPKKNVEVSLVPASVLDGVPRLTDTTGDNGDFVLDGLPYGTYKIIIREEGRASASTYLFEELQEAPLPKMDTLIKYSIRKGDK